MNFNEPICPICETVLLVSKHTEYNGDDDYGTDSYDYQCINGCSGVVDTCTEYGEVYLEPIVNNYDSEVL